MKNTSPVKKSQNLDNPSDQELDKIIEDSSEKNRNFFVGYLSLSIYVQAVVFSTTDLQLLTSTEGLKMPIIDLTLPLVVFYLVVPLFIVALHFNLLQNLESHHYKLMLWQNKAPGGKVLRSRIQPFLFDYAVLENEGQMKLLVGWANSLLCYSLAPITLGLVLIRFSDLQNPLVTIFHYVCFVFDVFLVWKLQLAMLENNKNSKCQYLIASIKHFFEDIPRYGLRGGLGFLILVETVLTISIGWTSDDFFVANVQPLVQPASRIDSILAEPVSWFLPRIAIDPRNSVWKLDKNALEVEAKLSEYNDDYWKYFKEHGKGFLPTTNSLRLASLKDQNLENARFFCSNLQGADLSFTMLKGANLQNAQLQGADLKNAHMQGANLKYAQLQGANLQYAQLQGADLKNAHMQGANLQYAQLQGANLRYAQLQGADLQSAKLQVADLSGAQLQGADLSGAQLQGADLGGAQVQGVLLFKTGIFDVMNLNDSSFPVFSLMKSKDMFDVTEPNWLELEGIAKVIPNTDSSKLYLQKLKGVKESKLGAKINWKHQPSGIARDALPRLCKGKDGLENTIAFRSGVRKADKNTVLVSNPEYLDLLNDIDTKLCTLDECETLRNSVKGLDCNAVTSHQSQVNDSSKCTTSRKSEVNSF